MLAGIDVLGLDVKTFGLFFALNFLAWGAIVHVRLKELGKPVDWAWEMVVVGLVGGFIGARLYFIVQNWNDTKGDLFGNVFGGAGLIWYGGLLGGTVAMLVWACWRDFVSPYLFDLAAVGLPIGYAIGRIGCQVSGDGDYGKGSDLPWAMPYPHGVVPTSQDVHPTPLYETLTMGTVGFVLWTMRDRVRPGGLFPLYLLAAGIERFLVEFARRNSDVAVGLTAAQFESLAVFAIGVVWAVVMHRRGGIFRPAATTGRPAPRSATA